MLSFALWALRISTHVKDPLQHNTPNPTIQQMKGSQRLGYFVVISIALLAGVLTAFAARRLRSSVLVKKSQQPAFLMMQNGELQVFAPHHRLPKCHLDLDFNHFAAFFRGFKQQVPALFLPNSSQPIALSSAFNSEAVNKTRFGFKKGFPRKFEIAFQPKFDAKLVGQTVALPAGEQAQRNGAVWQFVYAMEDKNEPLGASAMEQLISSIFCLYAWQQEKDK